MPIFRENPVEPAKCCLEGVSRHTEPERVPGDPRIKGTHPYPEAGLSGASPSSDTNLGRVRNKGSGIGALRICSED